MVRPTIDEVSDTRDGVYPSTLVQANTRVYACAAQLTPLRMFYQRLTPANRRYKALFLVVITLMLGSLEADRLTRNAKGLKSNER